MIRYLIDKNIFQSKADAIVNTVNCKGVMGKGLALQFKKKYPKMFKEYKKKCDKDEIKIGILDTYKAEDGRLIINFPTKYDWRNKSRIEYIEAGLRYFVEHYKEWGIKSVAFPQLGCGEGGLEWNTVKKIMEKYLSNLDIEIEIYVNQRKEYLRELKKLLEKLDTQQLKKVLEMTKQLYYLDNKNKFF
ncbi:MAG: macro domain-containing protein [Thermoplasmata archaeon]|nr:macro domain-containing protein [Thermoplasmata archaeon]